MAHGMSCVRWGSRLLSWRTITSVKPNVSTNKQTNKQENSNQNGWIIQGRAAAGYACQENPVTGRN